MGHVVQLLIHDRAPMKSRIGWGGGGYMVLFAGDRITGLDRTLDHKERLSPHCHALTMPGLI